MTARADEARTSVMGCVSPPCVVICPPPDLGQRAIDAVCARGERGALIPLWGMASLILYPLVSLGRSVCAPNGGAPVVPAVFERRVGVLDAR